MADRRVWCFMTAGLAAVTAYFWTPDTWVQTVSYDAIGFASVAAMVVGLRVHRPKGAVAWWLLLAGQFCYVAGDMVAAVMRRWLDLEPFPAPADYMYLTGYVLQALALLFLIRRRSGGRDAAALLEASIIAAAFALVSWVFFMKPITLDPDLTVTAKLISVGFPALDLLLLALLARLLAGGGSRNTAFFWLAGSVTLTLFGDYAWAFTDRMNYDGGTLFSHTLDAVFLVSYLACGAAALHPAMKAVISDGVRARHEAFGPIKLVLLTAATLIAPVLLTWQASQHRGMVSDATAIGAGSAGMFLLVIGRMVLLLRRVQTQSRALERQALALQQLAEHDPLTGLPNRRAWNVALPAALQRSRRSQEPVAVAIIDLDHFKRYNDTFGHQAGDRLLKSAAAVWSRRLRDVDLLARYGGEEFVVLLPGATDADAAALLDQLRTATPQEQTFSAGVAAWDGIENDETLLERADQALYTAKAAGRNQVTCAARTSTTVEAFGQYSRLA